MNAALIAVGDQPRIQAGTIAAVIAAWRDGPPQRIIIPSYQMRRGHPICLPRAVGQASAGASWQDSLRSLWTSLAGQIEHGTLDSPTILEAHGYPGRLSAGGGRKRNRWTRFITG
ncbi:NTP transferase domain-containing protein [Candidatus Amarobacter glycogenicus]|uniref:NTP transferase domain-containing protein n=1 Tax=Candidatus Amarobacter glycogenicus TaxID=3140699 RepID=UPI0031372463|nr:NTP transferase domain-containing protein [Dehalococcoidia bacterium]